MLLSPECKVLQSNDSKYDITPRKKFPLLSAAKAASSEPARRTERQNKGLTERAIERAKARRAPRASFQIHMLLMDMYALRITIL